MARIKNSFPIFVDKEKDITAVVTENSTNRKIGLMAQLSILVTSVKPTEALKTGKDEAICGDCPLRPLNVGGCYVTVARFAQAVWKSIQGQALVKEWSTAKPIRLGAYGDPAMLPIKLLAKVIKGRRWTGYTHQWKTSASSYAKFVMASIDKQGGDMEEQRAEATAKGYRTFRISDDGKDLQPDEILCPNYTKNVSCSECLLCDGKRGDDDKRKSIVIPVHGSNTKRYLSIENVNA